MKIAKNKNEEVVRVVEEMKKAEVKVLRRDEQQVEGDLVLKEEKVYVLKDEELRANIIWSYYDVPVIGYDGRWMMTELVIRTYQWLGVVRDMR